MESSMETMTHLNQGILRIYCVYQNPLMYSGDSPTTLSIVSGGD